MGFSSITADVAGKIDWSMVNIKKFNLNNLESINDLPFNGLGNNYKVQVGSNQLLRSQ